MMKHVVPAWMVKAAITSLIGLLLGGVGAWGAHLSGRSNDHEKRIAVVEDHQKGIDNSLEEIKRGQEEQSRDIKEILKRLPRR